jgi:YHS domain-containing protein
MAKIILVIAVICLLFFVGAPQAKSQQIAEDSDVTAESITIDASAQVVQPTEVGNKICPVSDEEIKDETKVTYEYEGKIYNFCCQMCVDEFKKDPERYIEKIEGEEQSESQESLSEEEDAMQEFE